MISALEVAYPIEPTIPINGTTKLWAALIAVWLLVMGMLTMVVINLTFWPYPSLGDQINYDPYRADVQSQGLALAHHDTTEQTLFDMTFEGGQ